MTKGIQFIQIVHQRGKFMVQGMGRTGRGTKFIIKQVVIDAKSIHDNDFKAKQAAAVTKLYESEA